MLSAGAQSGFGVDLSAATGPTLVVYFKLAITSRDCVGSVMLDSQNVTASPVGFQLGMLRAAHPSPVSKSGIPFSRLSSSSRATTHSWLETLIGFAYCKYTGALT